MIVRMCLLQTLDLYMLYLNMFFVTEVPLVPFFVGRLKVINLSPRGKLLLSNVIRTLLKL